LCDSKNSEVIMTEIPKGLSREARKLYAEVCETFEVSSPTQKLLLKTACGALDRLRTAEKLLRSDGITTRDRFGCAAPHPAIGIERSARAALVGALSKIGFSGEVE
jgi:phage terminase small subunit